MPTLGKTKVSPSLISTGSLFLGTSSYAVTASYAMNGGGGGSVQTGNIANQTILYNVTTSQDNVISGLNLSSNKWGVTVVEEWNSGSIVGDEYYNSCSLLLHFSGSNGSTTFIDNSPSPKTVTSNNGAAISTVQSKFGGASAYFDGTDDYLTSPQNAAFNFGTGDFTVEGWYYFTVIVSAQSLVALGTGVYGGTTYTGWGIRYDVGTLMFYRYDGTETLYTFSTTFVVNTWYHIACARNGTNLRMFVNGLQIGTTATSSTSYNNVNSDPLQIGKQYTGAGTSYFNGYIDELRITKGVARYTSNFATQSVEFYNNASVAQYATKYIGLVGGLNDSNVDYGVEKLNDSSLKIRKMTASGQPLSGSGALSASVDRVYVNVLDYTNVMVTSSYALTASYVLGGIQTGSISNQTILYNVTTSQDNTITGLDLSGNKWDVSVIEEWNSGSIVGDEYYNSCSLLMHFSGSNGSTTFVDNSPSPKTVTANGNAQISTAQSKFGGASLLLDGTGDYLTTTDNDALDLGSNNFTIEGWFYQTGNLSTGTGGTGLVTKWTDVSNQRSWLFSIKNAAGTAVFYYSTSGADYPLVTFNSVTLTSNTWTQFALVRTGNTLNLYKNGTLAGTSAFSSTIYNSTSPLAIGAWFGGVAGVPDTEGGNSLFQGYIDELRITKGVARYTGSFVTQSSEFPDNLNVTQLQTKYVGLVGGINDSTVDYGVEKLSDGSLKIRKMSASGQPLSGSGALSASVDRVYVNVLNYKEVQTTAQSASYAVSASYLINAASGESFHPFLLG